MRVEVRRFVTRIVETIAQAQHDVITPAALPIIAPPGAIVQPVETNSSLIQVQRDQARSWYLVAEVSRVVCLLVRAVELLAKDQCATLSLTASC